MSEEIQERRIFVCVKKRGDREASCARSGSLELISAMRTMLAQENIPASELDIRPCGCIDLCDDGPVLVSVSGSAAQEKKPPKLKKGKRGKLDARVSIKVKERELREILRDALRADVSREPSSR